MNEYTVSVWRVIVFGIVAIVLIFCLSYHAENRRYLEAGFCKAYEKHDDGKGTVRWVDVWKPCEKDLSR